ncbi:MAG: hypothetical protein HY784_14575, partial [Chloroflexi bacterium]|nr:hypothetical protein [Chloroflexota bacterium]
MKTVLEALTPAELELSLQALEDLTRQQEGVRRQWGLHLERSRYEAALAQRRYRQVEPENRCVARTLEREWEESLTAVTQAEQAYATAQREMALTLNAEEREQVLALAQDLPALWQAESTTTAERKEVLRLLLADVTLTRREADIWVQLRWVTNLVEEWTAPLPPRG